MLGFICDPCKTAAGTIQLRLGIPDVAHKVLMHSRCKGGTWCDCQHRVSKKSIV